MGRYNFHRLICALSCFVLAACQNNEPVRILARSFVATADADNDTPPAIRYDGDILAVVAQPLTQVGRNVGGPIENCIVDPSLPSGITLSSTTCELAGTPNAPSELTEYKVTASNAFGDSVRRIRIAVVDAIRVSQLDTRAFHNCALVNQGVMCWGINTYGGLGYGAQGRPKVPVVVKDLGPGSGVDQISTGYYHSCARVLGALKCWGGNEYGQLGDGEHIMRPTPVSVAGLGDVTTFSSGYFHTCAIDNEGIKCWGYNGEGELGNGSTQDSPVAQGVKGLKRRDDVWQLSAGGYHTCALVGSGAMCWGKNKQGQLGNGSLVDSREPVAVRLSGVPSAIAAGTFHACAIVNGGAKCWGSNQYGQLGDGSKQTRSSPVDVNGLSSGVMAIGASVDHSCAVVEGGVKCWGRNKYGQLGDGTTSDRLVPTDVKGLEKGSGVSAVSVGASHSCAVVNGDVKCWGYNADSEIGNRLTKNSNLPLGVAWY